jgi:superfamily II RNA helicase
MMSATLGDTSDIERRLREFSGREVAAVGGATRPVPLRFEYKETVLHETIEELVQEGEAPVYLVNFTQRACAEQAQNLMSINVTTKEEKSSIGRELEGTPFDTPYGKEFQRFVRHGIGVHHAGLLPRYRRVIERLAQMGLVKVISGTDTLGVGVNIPIRTVVLSRLFKFDGEKTGIVTAREFHQIAGRAGRKGFDDHGNVVVQAPEWVIENKKIDAKIAKSPHLKKKLVKKRTPPHAVPWDEKTFARLMSARPEPLEPRFEVTHGMLINLLRNVGDRPGGGYRRLRELIKRSHGSGAIKRRRRRRAVELFRSLRRAGVVELVPRGEGRGAVARVRDDLQEDFSLDHTLSLYLVEALEMLDPESETFALDALTLVESILEDPKAVLFRQLDRLKGDLVARLKAEGVPYEERMEQLEHVEHPKPNAEFVYESFAAFAEVHPWVGGEGIRPKSVAREAFERMADFNDYVLHYGLHRSEGVLLRYLSQTYKTALKNVPESYWDETFEDILAFLHGVVRRTDSSLLEEWEVLMAGPVSEPAAVEPSRPERPVSVADDPRAFRARVRGELHVLLGALSRRDYEAACNLLHRTDRHDWTPEAFEQALAPYFEEHAAIDVTPAARMAHLTTIREDEKRVWRCSQKIVDPEGDEDWGIECVIDLGEPRDETGPLIELIRIGV